MINFPNAKINLGLHVTGKRPDGYHEVETLFYPLKWKDALEFVPAPDEVQSFTLEVYGDDVGDYRDNLVFKAWQLLHADFNLPPVSAYVHKKIPHGAGLGGGSSDAASTLLLLNEMFQLHLSHDQLCNYAAKLGSDCVFFIYNKPMLATGRGDILLPANVDLGSRFIVVVMPSVTVRTADAYAMIQPAKPDLPLNAVIMLPLLQWKYALVNDFEKPVFEKYPEIKSIKEKLYISGASYASMSGSGAAVYGIFEKEPELKNAFPGCKVHISAAG